MAKKINTDTGTLLVVTYFVLFAVSSLVIYAANAFFPTQVVLGTMTISMTWALVHSMVALSLFNTFLVPAVREFENYRGSMFTDKEWMSLYLAANFIGLWIVGRFAEQLGLGMSSWVVVLLLAVALDFVQGLAMMFVEKLRT